MRIGINTLFLSPGKVGGTETYVRGLLYGLSRVDKANEYILFTNEENHDAFDVDTRQFSRKCCSVSARSKLARIAYEQMFLPKLAGQSSVDVLHSPGYVSPLTGNYAKVVTIHDMQYVYYPHYFPRMKLLYWKYVLPASARRSDIVITVSKHSKKDIVDLLSIPEDKIVVTYEASKFSRDLANADSLPNVTEKHDIRGNYILSVASLLPHKNLDKLVAAFALLEDKIDHQLVLVGLKAYGLNPVKEMIQNKLKRPDRVIVPGYVSDPDLESLYRKAGLFVLPSLFEGFGIPLLEAMALGCPVAASNRTSIPEVVGNAGVLFNPDTPEQIAEAIFSVLSDKALRDRLIAEGYQRARLFSWEKMAKETIGAYSVASELFQKKKCAVR